ncbi:MAG: cyclic nucleotide-binding domain-containing protein [Alphaproteobacteria bacterium]|nr:cyclic nucleotide-binding domain-containing protein [Alphaproteobacteria bacterium]
MAVRVKVAETAEELEALYRCRHRVYVEQGGYKAARPDGRVFDAYDTWPVDRCVNFIALVDDEVIGGVRLLLAADDDGTSSDRIFPFCDHFVPGTLRGSGSMLVVDQAYRHHTRLTTSLMSVFYHYAWVVGVQELYGCVNPHIWPACQRVGARALAPIPQTSDDGLPYVPFILWMPDMDDRFMAFIRRHGLREFLGVWHRQFFVAGQTVVAPGSPGEFAYVIVDGSAEMRLADGRRVTMFRPYLFGEEEMLRAETRDYEVVAKEDLDLIVLDRATFLDKVATQPASAFKFARLLLDHAPTMEAVDGGRGRRSVAAPDADNTQSGDRAQEAQPVRRDKASGDS